MRQLLAVLLLAFTLPANAQPYVFVGPSAIDISVTTSPDVSGSAESSVIFGGGYRINQNLEIEARAISARNSANDATWKSEGVGASIVGSLPVGRRLSVFGQISAYYLENTFRSNPRMSGRFAIFDEVQSEGIRPGFGIGARLDFSDRIGARLSFERIDGDHELKDLDVASLQLIMSF